MFDKYALAKEIGNFFGTYIEQDGKYCIDNYETIFRYDSVDALLTDWVDTLVEHQHDNPDLSGYWEAEIAFIYAQVIGKYPEGVRPVENKTKDTTWKASIDVTDPQNPHGKNLHLGTYASLVNAIVARKNFAARMELEPQRALDDWIRLAKEMQATAKPVNSEFKTVTHNLISAMVAYGQESCWTDRDIFDALRECGLSYEDFYKAGYGKFVRGFFREEQEHTPEEIKYYTADKAAQDLNPFVMESDPYLFTCCADNGFTFLVRGVNKEDAEKCGNSWYDESVFEAGKFECWKTNTDDLDKLCRNEILESYAYVCMVHETFESKKPLSQQISIANDKVGQQLTQHIPENELHR